MSDEHPESFNARYAALAVEGYNATQTLDVATVLGQQLQPRKDGAPKTALLVVIAALRRAAIESMQALADVEPTNAVKVAEHQAHIRAFLLVDKTVRDFIHAGEEMWRDVDRADREALAEIMGLELDDDGLEMGMDH